MVSLSNLASHAVDALADNNLGLLGITDIAAKYTIAPFSPDSITRLPRWRDARGSGRRAPGPPGSQALPDIVRHPVIVRALYQVARVVDSS
jgi:hypothetical protein